MFECRYPEKGLSGQEKDLTSVEIWIQINQPVIDCRTILRG